jgi:regulator of sigma E protease
VNRPGRGRERRDRQAPSTPQTLLEVDDLLVAVAPEGTDPVPVSTAEEYHRLLARWADRPLTFVFERRSEDPAKATGTATPEKGGARRITLTLPPNHFVDFGFRLEMEPIASIQNGSPAERAGFLKGDRIVSVDGKDFDPLQLPTRCYQHAGQTMTFEVERPDPGHDQPRTVELTVMPDDSPPWTEPILLNEPLELPGLGLAYHVGTRIESVALDSPADKAGLKKGDTINALTFSQPIDSKEKTKSQVFPEKYEFNEDGAGWAAAFYELQLRPRQAVQLAVKGSNQAITITPAPVESWLHPRRGLQFQGLVRHLPPQNASVALRRGFEDTIDNILGIYAMLRSLWQQRVSPKVLGGPIGIAQIAFASAKSSWTDLIHFLGILSINLAVLNFLPIPPLDGGQMAFLIAEGVRGKPLPDSAVIVGSWIGLLLVLALMVFVLGQGVWRLMFGLG